MTRRREMAIEMRGQGLTYAEIGRRLGLSAQTVWRLCPRTPRPAVRCIQCRRQWRPYGAGTLCPHCGKDQRFARARYSTPAEHEQARQMRARGMTYAEIGQRLGYHLATVRLWLI